MRLFVRGLSGATLAVEAETVQDVKNQISQAEGLAPEAQRLTFAGRSLAAGALAEVEGLAEDSTLFANAELQGGGKKRKKKTYTKPKKIKHKRKKVKLAVLKFYKVDSNDKVSRLRRECPGELCGPGVFMAMHFNRYYCGKCHLTYLIKKDEK